jgi:LysR family glycine cleavage system transcriptional activator
MDEPRSPVRARRRLPLAALRAFEAAAAHLSFQRAAEELGVTPAAVSHQVRSLEAATGTLLFHRLTRKVELTEDGAKLYRDLKAGFDAIEAAVAGLHRDRQRQAVVLTTNTAFAARWLLPRMGMLTAAVPGTVIRLEATEAVVDLARGEADLAVRSGHGDWPGLTVQLLAQERYLPVAAPTLGLTCPDDLQRFRLIEFDWHARQQPSLWSRWFREAGLPEQRQADKLAFSDENHAIEAVLAGHGVGLLSATLMAPELGSGALVNPFGPALATGGFYLAALPARRQQAAIAAIWNWFAEQFNGEGTLTRPTS